MAVLKIRFVMRSKLQVCLRYAALSDVFQKAMNAGVQFTVGDMTHYFTHPLMYVLVNYKLFNLFFPKLHGQKSRPAYKFYFSLGVTERQGHLNNNHFLIVLCDFF
jgi:hypothetical protein